MEYVLVVAVVGLVGVIVLAAMYLGSHIANTAAQNAISNQSEILVSTVKEIGAVLHNTAKTTVEAMMSELVGTPGKSIPQPPIVAQGDTLNPEWMTWDNPDHEGQAGIGDSVFFDRRAENGVDMIGVNESVIPGIPRPDLSGENFTG